MKKTRKKKEKEELIVNMSRENGQTWKTSKSRKGYPSFKILTMDLEDLGCNKRKFFVGTSNVAARSMTRPSLEFNLRNEEPPWV
ncbi:hypothetical protein V1478_001394 [Vespula squamosa]|uniref:Uncharacterized protein n=1 Tax=Vespula squamosa TaxID=30214 RepID=A0ABD2C338_VESSQ